jgi:hypothetical protein
MTTVLENPIIKGSNYRSTHKLAVIGVLGDRAPRVSSRGSHFFNVDRWTVRMFTFEMCQWAAKNPQCIPTRKEITEWVRVANAKTVPLREIVIANTPSKLTLRTALALTGGAYHEAFHTYYSCLRTLKVDEMVDLVLARWAKVPDWSRYHMLLQEWSNIVEDVRIERHGQIEFPGSRTKLHDLQDFILHQEAKGLANARAHSAKPVERGALSVITATFRDIGLGYNTDTQREALENYRKENPDGVVFVLGKGKGSPGPLTGLLKETIALTDRDDLGCLRVAMDVIGVLYDKSSEVDPANDPKNKDHQPGETQKLVCPSCGVKGSKLVIRPKADGRGGKVPGKGILTCSVCGHQEEVDLQAPQKGGGGGKGQKGDPEHTPKFEGFDKPEKGDKQQGGGGEGSDGDDDDKDGEGGGKGKKGDKDKDGKGSGEGDDGDDKDGEGSGSGKDGDEGDAGDGSGKSGDEGGDDKGKGSSGDGDDGDGELKDEGGTEGASSQNQSNTDADSATNTSAPGGGHNYEEGPVEGNDWSCLADDANKESTKGAGLKDNNSALEAAVGQENKEEQRVEGGVKGGETAWSPFDQGIDQYLMVEPSRRGKDHDREQAERLYASVKDEASYLRSRLRSIVKALEMVSVVHGTRRGRRLSSRFLVDSKVSLMGKNNPQRAYKQTDAEIDTSFAAAVVIDESGSMSGCLQDATKVLCAIAEPLDSLGCPVQVSGFRDGGWYDSPNASDEKNRDQFHRFNGIVHDIFKAFDEPLRSVKWRFANTRATGGTPMADGVQFGLDGLSVRNEGHRILFVITDGQPNSGHKQIIRRQIRLAKAAGIHVIGVGLGYGAEYVKDVFPDSVWSRNIADMPKALIAKLNELVDVKAAGRGKRMAKVGD